MMDTRRTLVDDDNIALAVQLLRNGELVAFPTDTVYGLGASVLRPAALAALYRVKQRPPSRPLVVLVADVAMGRRHVAQWPSAAEALARTFWPGPLTLVLPRAAANTAAAVAGDGATVALRVPDHPTALALLTRLGEGLATSSANLSGEPPPRDADAVMAQLAGHIPLVLDGGRCAHGNPSTIVALDEGDIRILRDGVIGAAAIARVVAAHTDRSGQTCTE